MLVFGPERLEGTPGWSLGTPQDAGQDLGVWSLSSAARTGAGEQAGRQRRPLEEEP